ncbi:MAG: copper transporter [Candidatus Aquicultorales bacterium]
MFDIRYHIVSLIAVFLALAIGLILGTVVVDKGILVEQQKALVEKLEKDFGDLRTTNSNLNKEIQVKERYINQSFYPLIQNKLIGKHVAVVFTAKIENGAKRSILEALQWSGATVSVVTFNLPFDLENQEFQEKIAPAIQEAEGANYEQKLLNRLAEFYNAPPGDNKLLLDLSTAGLLSVETLPMAPTSAVLIVGGSEKENLAKKVDVVFIDRLKALEMRVVGCETTTRKVSYMNAYQKTGITTVDNIDQRMGQVSAILALGGAAGDFGIKPTAKQLIPIINPH